MHTYVVAQCSNSTVLYNNSDKYYWDRYKGPIYCWTIFFVAAVTRIQLSARGSFNKTITRISRPSIQAISRHEKILKKLVFQLAGFAPKFFAHAPSRELRFGNETFFDLQCDCFLILIFLSARFLNFDQQTEFVSSRYGRTFRNIAIFKCL